ncbi:MAG: S-layer homology domain-containing protein [Bacillota bacterium]|nr:S-layer homology domain-containing protein [Bacillota bacterium]
MKKTLAVILCMALIPISALAKFNDVSSTDNSYQATMHLAQYGVLAGDTEGNFNPNAGITRAEFAKIAVIINGGVAGNSASGLFTDLSEGYWANGYINAAAKNKLILGYPNGTFNPESGITFAEGVTIILRLLGYTSGDLGNNYPDAYLEKAAQLGLTKGFSLTANDLLDRKSVAIIADRALMCDINTSNSRKSKLITKMNYTMSDECIILATQAESRDLMADEVSTSIGTYKTKLENIGEYVGATAKLVLDTDGNIAGIIKTEKKHKKIAVENVAGKELSYRENGAASTIKFDNNYAVYYNSSKSTYADIADEIEEGMVMDIYYTENGGYDYAILYKSDMEGPSVIYTDEDKYTYGTPTRVIRDGHESALEKLEKYDVIYYSKATDTLYAYCDRATGVYEKAYPSKADISKITLSGTDYQLETTAAVNALNENAGAYEINDYIVCLLGKDGKIAAVVPKGKETSSDKCGVILSCDERVSDGTKKYYVTCLSANGNEQEFETDKDYSQKRGKIVSYSFDEGIFKPSLINTSQSFSGAIYQPYKAIGSYAIASDCKIVDVAYAPAAGENHDAIAKVIELSEITKTALSSTDVIYCKTENGKITALFLNNVTKSGYQFGIATGVATLSSTATYTVDVDGKENTYSVNFVTYGITKNAPVMIKVEDSRLLSIEKLTPITTSGKIESINKNEIIIGSSSYKMAKDAKIYTCVSGTTDFRIVSADDLDLTKATGIKVYSDTGVSSGGLARVIIIAVKK